MKRARTILMISTLFCSLVLLNIKAMGKLQNLTGKTVGKITVVRFHGTTGSGRTLMNRWLCKCLACGHEFTARTGSINSGSVGCKPCSWEDKKTHGMWRSPEFSTWQGIQQRCYNPKDDKYHNYGGRGIIVCDRWMQSFQNFYSDMGARPYKKTLDRINVNGNYEPENCRWATNKEQQNNRRNNTYLTFNRETLTQKQWCERLGLKESTVHNRILSGMSVEEAFTKPVAYKS